MDVASPLTPVAHRTRSKRVGRTPLGDITPTNGVNSSSKRHRRSRRKTLWGSLSSRLTPTASPRSLAPKPESPASPMVFCQQMDPDAAKKLVADTTARELAKLQALIASGEGQARFIKANQPKSFAGRIALDFTRKKEKRQRAQAEKELRKKTKRAAKLKVKLEEAEKDLLQAQGMTPDKKGVMFVQPVEQPKCAPPPPPPPLPPPIKLPGPLVIKRKDGGLLRIKSQEKSDFASIAQEAGKQRNRLRKTGPTSPGGTPLQLKGRRKMSACDTQSILLSQALKRKFSSAMLNVSVCSDVSSTVSDDEVETPAQVMEEDEEEEDLDDSDLL